ncbi:MAG: radical SAM family heme chaperone HemW [Verrucomicrobiae bacterium]|nr:radical SAM family heme chaperone HemW [Verrucomicrobiae bacterium]
MRHLYVHVPFCLKKCPYCAFYSEPISDALAGRYISALVREIELYAEMLFPETVYFGGGTPSLLEEIHLREIGGLFERLGWTGIREWTVEVNPATLTKTKARLLRDLGVNRVSLGVQSLDDEVLVRLGRVHSAEEAVRSFELLREAGFENINVDLIFGVPGQTLSGWEKVLVRVLALRSEHLSAYELTYEEDTPFFLELARAGTKPDEELACDMYEMLVEAAGRHGLVQYEVSNFARGFGGSPGWDPVYACWHNVNYWRGGDYVGVGPGAASFVGGVYWVNTADVESYCAASERGSRAIMSAERLSPLARAGQTAAFGLRMTRGWLFTEFRLVTGFDLMEEWGREIEGAVRDGLAVIEGERFRLTPKGLRFADRVGESFLR